MPHSSNGLRAQARWHALVWLLTAACAGAVQAEPSHADTAPPESETFSEGSRLWSVTEGTSRHRTFARLYATQVAVSQYVRKNLALEYGAVITYADAERNANGFLAGPEFGMRWHAMTGRRWSAYMDGVVGAVFQEHPLSQDSLRFNFDVQAGFGGTYRMTKQELLLGGFRWQHLSNCQIRGRRHNLGYDAPMLYLGMARSF